MRSGYNSSYTSGVSVTGAWAAKVVSVDNDKHLSVKIPRLGGENVYTEVYYSGITPSAGDEIWVTPIEGKPGKLLAITGSPDISGIEGDVAQLQVDTTQVQADLSTTSDSVDGIDERLTTVEETLTTVEETTIPALDTRVTALEDEAPEWKYKTTTSFSIDGSDNNAIIETFDSVTETVIGIPLDNGTNFTQNIQVSVIRGGDGNVTFNPDSGVTLNSPNGYESISNRYSKVDLLRKAKDIWYLSGDLTDLTEWEIVGSPLQSSTAYSLPNCVDLSSDGSIIAVSERNAQPPSSPRGQVKVFEEVFGSWSQRGSTIVSTNSNSFPLFGWEVKMTSDGSKIVVSSPNANPYGEITTYIWNGTNYALSHTLSNPSIRTGRFGISLDMSADGNWMVVSSQTTLTEPSSLELGEVFIYQWSSSSWTLFDTITVSTTTTFSNYTGFGFSVAISDDGLVVAVGEPGAQHTIVSTGSSVVSGKVNIYERLNLSMNLRDEILYDTDDARAGYDCDLSDDGSVLVVGSLNENSLSESGSVRVFQYSAVNSTWNKLGPDINGSSEGDQFGYTVSISDDGQTIAVGSPFSDYSYINSGAVYIYDWNADKFSWEQRGKTIVAETLPLGRSCLVSM